MDSAHSQPLQIAVIGAGHHSRTFHLPALAHYADLHPGTLSVAAIVDPDPAAASAALAACPACRVFADAGDMLAQLRPDACVATTPVALNAAMAAQLARAGLPVLMEKPPGATLAEARRLVADLAAASARVMVSMNRRFDPLLQAALAWIGPRPIRDVRATMARHDRTEPMFVEHTGLHVVDVVRALGGEIVARELRRRRAGAGDWFEASLQFASGATGRVELRPMARALSESLHLAGDDFRVEIRSAEFDRGGWQAWSGDRLVVDHSLAPGTPKFVGNGTYAETEAFLHAVRSGGAFSPTPADVLPAMELCHALEHAPASSSAILL